MKQNRWTIKYRSLAYIHILGKVHLCVILIHYTNYNIHPSNNLEGIKQTHQTMK